MVNKARGSMRSPSRYGTAEPNGSALPAIGFATAPNRNRLKQASNNVLYALKSDKGFC
ncbi:hypothetical protein SAMD00079811_66000 [Scytonema sp. HK-05]|uniref:hypothetical protein n=1 Tax=Scytonema sp. HK-05 TaxID=1137095 RepID=UPI000B5E7021|nr:hypothetical protein [Scytonema sp. HK-05]BAY48971.1 hypothetical protein SAMD00079811_66000 [Scytonema sp. HK-05]